MTPRALINRLFPKDDFRDDWYGWLTNQISHIALGVGIAIIVCGITLATIGEFPVKWAGWLSCAAIYAIAEYVRSWNGWDTIEDWVFVAAYGSGGAFLAFTEVAPGSTVLAVDVKDLPWLLGVMAAHLVVGAYRRGRDA